MGRQSRLFSIGVCVLSLLVFQALSAWGEVPVQIKMRNWLDQASSAGIENQPGWTREEWRFGPEKRTIWMAPALGVRINEVCRANLKCEALNELRQLYRMPHRDIEIAKTLKRLTSVNEGEGGKDPASLFCAKALFAKIYFGVSPRGNRDTFCVFEDGSAIATGTLAVALTPMDSK